MCVNAFFPVCPVGQEELVNKASISGLIAERIWSPCRENGDSRV